MEKSLIEKMKANSYLGDGNLAYIETLYDAYLQDPTEVSDYWKKQFDEVSKTEGVASKDVPLGKIKNKFLELAKKGNIIHTQALSGDALAQQQQVQVGDLINAYRAHGHHAADLDPLGLANRLPVKDLDFEQHGFTKADLNKPFEGFEVGKSGSKLGAILSALKKTYCGKLGVEFLHITDYEQTQWIQERLEAHHADPQFSDEKRQRIYRHVSAAEGLEKYLGSKYVGQKRFSLEGALTLIPMMDELVQLSGELDAKEIVIGMAHRGRLNVLVNVLGKSPEKLFAEFEGKNRLDTHSGDVKYHMGFSSNVKTSKGPVHLALAFNPSHLEIINPVVEGSVRARQTRRDDGSRDEVIPVLIHGDAALAGQGVVAETFNFSQARGFNTGGTIHIVVNNQIGFTTSNPLDSRSTLYCTDVAKMVQAPVFHVNGDDPDLCVFAIQMAVEFRKRFKKDVMVDLVCYRKHGHNEADEPSGTQPLMYQKIKSQKRTREIYAEQLIQAGVLTKESAKAEVKNYREALEKGETVVELVKDGKAKTTVLTDWKKYLEHDWSENVDTAVPMEDLVQAGKAMTSTPDDFKLQAQVAKEYENRKKMLAGENSLNWGCAETLAYATLLTQGYAVRLCGQDSGRGTFSHRHSVLHDANCGEVYIPLQHINPDQRQVEIIDSVLSEESVLAFEYGYATTTPNTLVIWEAQFGDFANGAQVVFDQFISSGEQKWQRLCGIAVYLPHGYEGQGPEHSSARLERYLQLCAENNMQVCVPSTPAQMFHMIRRQMVRPYRKPLIVLTPKSLLRHKLAVSSLEDLAEGKFHLVIPEVEEQVVEKVKKVVLCSGKVYYDLLEYRMAQKINDVAILRVEQLYPFPVTQLTQELKKYKNAKEVVWCQEEPQNQGAWYSSRHHFEESLASHQRLDYVGRSASASPATGYTSLHLEQQTKLVKDAIG